MQYTGTPPRPPHAPHHTNPTRTSKATHLGVRLLAILLMLTLAACSSGGGGTDTNEPAPLPTTGTLRIAVEPASAELTIDQDGTLVTRRTGGGDVKLEPGTYMVTGRADGHEDASRQAVVNANSTTQVNLTLNAVDDAPDDEVPDDGPTHPNPGPGLAYGGEWVWVVVFAGTELTYEGFLSISERVEDTDRLTNNEAGAWRWCTLGLDRCPGPTGIGMFSTFDRSDFVASFIDEDMVKMIGIEDDGRLEVDEDGYPTFIGLGSWYFYAGGEALVGVGLARISDQPVFSSLDATEVEPITRFPEPAELTLQTSEDTDPEALRETVRERLEALQQRHRHDD